MAVEEGAWPSMGREIAVLDEARLTICGHGTGHKLDILAAYRVAGRSRVNGGRELAA